MTFQDDNGNTLDFLGEFAMTKQAVSILGFKIKGDVSINFDIDNNSVNREILNYTGPQMLTQTAWTKQSFSRVKNGNVLDRGYIIIQEDNGDKLSCFYVSGNANWVNSLSVLITELDFYGITGSNDYTLELSAATVLARISSTDGIVFPMVDWTRNLRRSDEVWWMVAKNPITAGSPIVDKSNEPFNKSIFDFYPCFHIKSLMEEVMLQNGLKLSGDLIEDSLYNSLIMSPISGQMKRKIFNWVYAEGTSKTISAGTTVKYDLFTEKQDPESLFASSRYTSNKKVGLIFTVTTVVQSGPPANFMEIFLYKNGVSLGNYGSYYNDDTHSFRTFISNPGDYFEIYVQNPDGSNQTVTLNLKIEIPEVILVGDYVSPSNFLPDWRCIDFVKNVFSFFGCEVAFDEYSKTITANIIEKMKLEDAPDFSDYYVSHSSSYTTEQAKRNYLRFQESPDSGIVQFNKVNRTGYGNGLIETGNDLKQEKDLFKLPWIASTFGNDLDARLNKSGTFFASCPLLELIDTDTYAFTATPTGGTSVPLTFTDTEVEIFFAEIVRIVNDTGEDLGYFVISSSGIGTAGITLQYVITAAFTGSLIRQQINFLTQGPRLLVYKPSLQYVHFSTAADSSSPSWTIITTGGGGTTSTTASYAWFCKKQTGLAIDGYKDNVAFENPVADFIDPTVKERYFNKISNFLNNPDIRFRMLIPEAVFQSFDFSNFIYLETKDLTGYFLVESIENYRDGSTPVDVRAYML